MNFKTRLQELCEIHNQQGGTIWQFNRLYNTDFITMSDRHFNLWCQYITLSLNWDNLPKERRL